jgi:holliday junction DNA helicase RuvA
MIEYIKGKIQQKFKDKVIIEIGSGIGYKVNVSSASMSLIPNLGEEILLYIFESTSMYGTGTTWYGFLSTEERDIFERLKAVSKIGAKGALEILGKINNNVSKFKEAVIDQDIKTLVIYFNFTKKTAEKLIAGLKSKIKDLPVSMETGETTSFCFQVATDVINSLVAMGYKANIAASTVQNVLNESETKNVTAQELIKKSLKYMASK